jgi:hypothetical protein
LVAFDPLGEVTTRRRLIISGRFRRSAFLPTVVNCTRTLLEAPGATFWRT